MENKQFSEWHELLLNAQRVNEGAAGMFAQLATIASDSTGAEVRPSAQSVAPKGFLGDGLIRNDFDIRSEKKSDIASHSQRELCWHFSETREQFRFSARANIIQCSDGQNNGPYAQLLENCWSTRSDAFMQSLSWPQPRGNRTQDTAFTETFSVSAPPH